MFSELKLPEPIVGLLQLARNFRSTWHRPTKLLFEQLNLATWDEAGHNPYSQLMSQEPDHLAELAQDEAFVASVQNAQDELATYLTDDTWFSKTHPGSKLRVAYFSPEFGISEALPQYSGGLGILAGDHLKTASDLGLPLLGVGLFYQFGYYEQVITDGQQTEVYVGQHPSQLGLELCDINFVVEIGGYKIQVVVWKANIGRVTLYMLDTANAPSNDPALKSITDRLYGGDHAGVRPDGEREHRLLQEIILGIGGVKALRALDENVTVYHSNEGHAGFSSIERIRETVLDQQLNFDQAVAAVRKSTVFTTHTPVPAGIDQFTPHLMAKYFDGLAQNMGQPVDRVLELGRAPGEYPGANFNMATLGVKTAQFVNGVSQLHGDVSRELLAASYGLPPEDVPIFGITNGVHPITWAQPRFAKLYQELMGKDWPMAGPDVWRRVEMVRDDYLWKMRNASRSDLVAYARQHLTDQLHPVGEENSEWAANVLDENVLTLVFSRRAADYKRLWLLFSQPERLRQLLVDPDRPMQIVIAGKAHPHDGRGHEIIEMVHDFARDPAVRHRIVFLGDYDMHMASIILGADVCLNLPRRPHEASGTSGEKAVYNGALNLSINDGWWAEMGHHGFNGYVIEDNGSDHDSSERLFHLLEHDVRETFYARDTRGVPVAWMTMVKNSLVSLGARVSSPRMVKEYVEKLYLPALEGAHIQ